VGGRLALELLLELWTLRPELRQYVSNAILTRPDVKAELQTMSDGPHAAAARAQIEEQERRDGVALEGAEGDANDD
jgi:hypothetical protein